MSQARSEAARPRREPWIIRTYAGFGDARQANQRFRQNLEQGQRGLSVAFDLPTQNGYDPDAPLAAGEIGKAGVSIAHWRDLEQLFEGIPLDEINVSMTINATAPFLFALYLVVAEKHGIAWSALRGTTQNDLMKELVARGTSIFEPGLSFRLSTELIRYAVEHAPNWNPINCCGYHYMESGAGPVEEIAYALANALLIIDALRPQLSQSAFEQTVRRISFFINSGIELVPEICKVRAYARLWRELCASEYQVEDVVFRAGCQVRSLTLTEQQPEVNIVRIAYEALPVVLSADARVNALQLPGFREAIALPDAAEQLLGLRTQQVLMYETGVADYADIFAGSVVIEKLTAETVSAARRIVSELRASGYTQSIAAIGAQLTRMLGERQQRIEGKLTTQIGVNAFLGEIGLARPAAVESPVNWEQHARERIAALAAWRANRDSAAVASAREKLAQSIRQQSPSMEVTLELARAGGTVGEWAETIADASRGRYLPPILEGGASRVQFEVPRAPRRIRIALGKAGLDGHLNAVKLLAQACMQAGMEVILAGFKQTPAQLVEAALQEDAEVLAISSLAGAHLAIAQEVRAELDKKGRADLKIVMGGIIPEPDRERLRDLGVRRVFTPKDSNLSAIVSQIIEVADAL